jgi:phosphate/phosphite/phosphonate ABC transporter binding protein
MQLIRGAQGFADALGGALHLPVRLTVATDYDKLLEGVVIGGVDVAWMPPLVQMRATRQRAVLAAVSERAGGLLYRSALLVRTDSPYRVLSDLKGARAAWTDRSSASGYLFPRLYLASAGIDAARDLGSETFFGSPEVACAAVASGKAELCACFITDEAGADRARALGEVKSAVGEVAAGLRVLDVTGSIPPDGMVLAAPLDGRHQSRVRDALLGLHEEESGAAAIRALLNADRLAPVTGPVVSLLSQLGRYAID